MPANEDEGVKAGAIKEDIDFQDPLDYPLSAVILNMKTLAYCENRESKRKREKKEGE